MKLGKKEWARWAEWIERVKSDLPATVNDRAVFHWTAKGSTAGPRSRQGCGYPRRGCLQVHLSADRQGVQQLEGDGAVRLEEGLQGAAAETARVGPGRSASKGPPSRTWLLQSQGSRSPDLLAPRQFGVGFSPVSLPRPGRIPGNSVKYRRERCASETASNPRESTIGVRRRGVSETGLFRVDSHALSAGKRSSEVTVPPSFRVEKRQIASET